MTNSPLSHQTRGCSFDRRTYPTSGYSSRPSKTSRGWRADCRDSAQSRNAQRNQGSMQWPHLHHSSCNRTK